MNPCPYILGLKYPELEGFLTEDELFNWFRGSFTQLPHSYPELDVPFVFKYPPNTAATTYGPD
jgi:hypothetical protein